MKPKLLLTWAALLSVTFTTRLRAELLDPLDFTPLGTFIVTNGGYIIDTDAVTITETNGVSTNLHLPSSILVPGGARRIVVHPSPNAVLPKSRL